MNNELNKSKNEKIPISIYTNKKDIESFSAGIVSEINETEIILESIDMYGEYDGEETYKTK